ncbi:hypothetical protein ACOME3_008923 [Neoechinorhynchus agilis]
MQAGHLTPEWQSQYIEYRTMKNMLYEIEKNRESRRVDILDANDEAFFQLCEMELEKVNAFFFEKITEAKRRFQTLKNSLESDLSKKQLNGKKPVTYVYFFNF